jgi:hypothetical protein
MLLYRNFYSAVFLVALFSCFAAIPFSKVHAQATADEKPYMFLVALDVADMKDVPVCFTTKCDKDRIKIYLDQDENIDNLTVLSSSEDDMKGPEGFIPEIKLVYKNYTYIVSMYCTAIKMYKNETPYTPSATEMKSDLEMTSSVYAYLYRLKKQYFPNLKPNPAMVAKIKISAPLEFAKLGDDDIDPKELEKLLGDDEDDEKDMEKDVKDEGEFDKIDVDDPSLDVDKGGGL